MKTALQIFLFVAVTFGPISFLWIQIEREKRRRAALRKDSNPYWAPTGSEAAGIQGGSVLPPADVSHHHHSGGFPGMIDGGSHGGAGGFGHSGHGGGGSHGGH